MLVRSRMHKVALTLKLVSLGKNLKEEKIMRDELKFEDMESVSGGRYAINGNTHQVAFMDAKKVFKLKNCTDYQAMELMDSLIGQYSSEKEYDEACIAKLQAKGWI